VIKINSACSWFVQCLIHTLGWKQTKMTYFLVFLSVVVTKKNNGPITSLLESIRRLLHAQAFLANVTH